MSGGIDVDAAVAQLSAAVRELTAAGQNVAAAMACVRLGDVYALAMGNLVAGRAWFGRAWRLIEHEPPCVEQGWVALAGMGCDVDDPERLLAAAEIALERARRFGDVNLETKALADGGLALVRAGRVLDGMGMLDEAMALVCGPADDPDARGRSVCSFFAACYHAADFGRVESWSPLLRRQGMISTAPGPPVYLSGHCDSVTAAMLMELGRFEDAEALLRRAIADFEAAMPMPSFHPAIALAELRIRQGRRAEAEALLVGLEHHVEALLPAARLHLSRGDHALARATAQRGLRAVSAGDRLRAVELLALVVDAALAEGDLAAAEQACADLEARLPAGDCPAGLAARAGRARAWVLVARGETAGAAALLEDAIALLDAERLPVLRTELLAELADLQSPARPAPGSPSVLCAAGTAWTVTHGGVTGRLPDTKGLRYLAILLAAPGNEKHALDLVDSVEGVHPDGPDRRALGDAGELLDEQARTAYRHRIEQLRSEADEAIEAGRYETAERIGDEIDALVRELARAFGLSGAPRKASSVAEKARLNVTRAIRAAIARIGEAVPGAADGLDRHVRTGLYCAYEPPADAPRWVVQSALNGTARH